VHLIFQENIGFQSMMIPTIAVISEILTNCYIIWFSLINYPAKCTRLGAETAGRHTCGLKAGRVRYCYDNCSDGSHWCLFPREVELLAGCVRCEPVFSLFAVPGSCNAGVLEIRIRSGIFQITHHCLA
jgi:hypothetical protein